MSEKRDSIRICLVLLLAVALMAVVQPVMAQEVTAAITGSVADPSGAPIVGANVTAIDTARGVTYPTKTNEQGIYNIQRIPVASYKLEIEAKGFQKTIHPAFTLVLNQTARVDVQMKIGQTTEVVEVSAAAPLLQTDTTQLSTVIDDKMNVSLPLATRNYVQLTLLTPGAVNPDPASFVSGQDMTTKGRPYINGNRQQENNFMLDGMDNNQLGDNEVGYSPSVDAIQEFNLIAQNPSAEYGNFMGGAVSASIKSGTNQFHGDAYEFFRNDVLNANSWQNGLTGAKKNPLRWNLFGATLGGPIVKNKLFFFMDYEGQRQDHPGTAATMNVIPTSARNGDLGFLCANAGGTFNASGVCSKTAGQVYNPYNVVGGVRQPFANNLIPTIMFDSVVKNLFASSAYAAPSSGDVVSGKTASQYNNDQGDMKIDYSMSEKDRMFARYSQMYLQEPVSTTLVLAHSEPNFVEEPAKNVVLNWTHTFSPTFLNEFRTGFNWVKFGQADSANSVGNLGIGNALSGLPRMVIGSNYSDIGNNNITQNFGDTVIQLGDTLVITKGRHMLHTGFQFTRYRMDSSYSGNSGVWGEMDFGGSFTQGAGGVGGASIADFLLGLPTKVQRGGAAGWGQRSSMYAMFFQDDWRLTDELTVNLGLRYENHTPWVEVQNRELNFGMYTGAVEFAGQQGNSNALYNPYDLGTDFQPRIGFAYSPKALHNKTVFRGAYALSSYAESMGSNNRLPQNVPFVPPDSALNYDGTQTNLPGSTLSQGFPALTGVGAYTGITQFANAQIKVWDPNWRPAVSQQWNFSVQQQLSNSVTLQLGYVGQHNTHLTNFWWANQAILNSDGTTTPGPFVAGNPTLKNEIGAIRLTLSNGRSQYKAFQAVLDKRFSQGLQGQLAYTLSNCKTDAVGFYGNWTASQTTIGMPSPQDIYNPNADYGNCNFDATHVLTGYLNYALPFGKGKEYGNNMNAIANAFLGNWEVGGIYSFHTGFAINFVNGWTYRSGTGDFMERPDVVGTVSYPKKHVTYADGVAGIQWIDPSAFQLAPLGQFGNEKVGDLRGPGLNTFDLSVHKAFPLSETKKVEFRVEAMNLFNHPVLYFGAGNLYSAAFAGAEQAGLINQSRNERNIQLALKFYF